MPVEIDVSLHEDGSEAHLPGSFQRKSQQGHAVALSLVFRSDAYRPESQDGDVPPIICDDLRL